MWAVEWSGLAEAGASIDYILRRAAIAAAADARLTVGRSARRYLPSRTGRLRAGVTVRAAGGDAIRLDQECPYWFYVPAAREWHFGDAAGRGRGRRSKMRSALQRGAANGIKKTLAASGLKTIRV